jgi:hypothetical protein
MNFIHLPQRHHEGEKPGETKETKDHPEKCPTCGRQLMERKGLFRRLTPISNAFVVYGNCLACHSDEDTVDEDRHATDDG